MSNEPINRIDKQSGQREIRLFIAARLPQTVIT